MTARREGGELEWRYLLDSEQYLSSFAQECVRRVPVIVLGSGASAAHKIPGMVQLGNHLAASIPPHDASDVDNAGWDAFLKRVQVTDLESALTEINLTKLMTDHVVSTTWNYLNPHDLAIFDQVVEKREHLPLSLLFRHILASTVKTIHVVTPNYDRLGEYAAEAAGFSAFTGFTYGNIGVRTDSAPSLKFGKVEARTVCVWKVHGSFGWFAGEDGLVTALPPRASCPPGVRPVIITPGVEKYRLTHQEPFLSIKASADKAIRAAESFLCIGFGFNDTHLQPLLLERCQVKGVPIVLITRTLTDKAKDLFKSGRVLKYLALEKCDQGTRIYSNDQPDGLEVNGNHWQLDEFLKLIL